ncbi:hypothetical protein RRF57_003454 [Xylaria bambusicola]|uniref:Enoyl reductase (ER) domain-containing protein n=1 Tax=Xylaria bambusicola TaxID=326684 RepID=A0AAN7UUD0_9PEZI
MKSPAAASEASVIRQLRQGEYEITTCTLEDGDLPLNQDVLCLLDLDGPFFESISSTDFEALQNLIKRLMSGSAGVLWATPLCQMGCRQPDYASVIGFARTMRSELSLDFATCEVENWDTDAPLLVHVLDSFLRRKGAYDEDDIFKPDFEYAIRKSEVNVGRYYPFTLYDELMTTGTTGRASLDIKTPGRISTLGWEQRELEPLRSCEVELEVHATGLNFRDVLVAMNIVELSVRRFGLEAAGIVTRVGSEVADIKVGDRVVCLKKQAFATKIVVEELACAVIPDYLSFDEAACMIFAFATAIQSLVNVGRLEKGQMLEAKIYATVGNEEKVEFLIDNFGVPRSNIFNSRDESFAKDLMSQTGNKGVDLVLNSFSGELVYATWIYRSPSGSR